MHIKFEPVAGETKITARIEDGGLTINGKVFGYDTVPAEGPVRAQDNTITVRSSPSSIPLKRRIASLS